MPELYNTCLRCGRKLKTARSKELGYGKVCWLKYLESKKTKKLFEMVGDNNASK